MRIIKLFTTIVAVLAVMALPIAAEARGHHRARAAAVVRSFKHGVLSIRMPGGRVKSADVTEDTDLTCQASARQRRRVKRRRHRARSHRARAALDGDDAGDDGADNPAGDDPGDEDGSDDIGNDGSDDAGDDSGDDFVKDDNEVDDSPADEPQGGNGGKGGSCTLSTLRRGAKVKAAKLGSDRAEWAKIVLVRR